MSWAWVSGFNKIAYTAYLLTRTAIALRMKKETNATIYGAVIRDGVAPILISLDTNGNAFLYPPSHVRAVANDCS